MVDAAFRETVRIEIIECSVGCIAEVTLLKCKDTGFEFLFFNLHMDHIGKKARVESAYLVQDKMKELGKGKELPAILTGDFYHIKFVGAVEDSGVFPLLFAIIAAYTYIVITG